SFKRQFFNNNTAIVSCVQSPPGSGVHYMLLRHTLFGTMLELQLESGSTLAHFSFRASDEEPPMWCRGSFAVRGALQCRRYYDELRQRPCRTPITQAGATADAAARLICSRTSVQFPDGDLLSYRAIFSSYFALVNHSAVELRPRAHVC
ncbi:unnamed protein product, partial [Polarella glacialis]